MTDRRNFSMDDEAAALLDDHPNDNHSKIIRELLKEYYTAGVYDTTEAAIRVRRRELERQKADLEAEREAVSAELDRLDGLDDSDTETSLEQAIDETPVYDPEKATVDNPLVDKLANEYGVENEVVVEKLAERIADRRAENLSSVGAD